MPKRPAAPLLLLLAFLLTGWHCGKDASGDPPPSAQAELRGWEGVWVAEQHFGPRLYGPVTLHRAGAGWAARLQGETTTAERREDADGSVQWSFAFFDQGRFEGRQVGAAEAIEGHWYQAPGPVEVYPFATPVRLAPAGDEAFSGEVVPFQQDVSLNIYLGADGQDTGPEPTQYRTFLRNPERNLGIFFRIETATVEGDEIRFANRDGDVLAVGQSVEPGERFSLLFPRFGETLDFTRRSREDAPGFYARRSAEGATNLARPPEIGDGWPTASPEDAGLDAELLTDLVASMAAFEPTALRQPYIHGLLIAHRGQLVVEEYFHGYHREVPHDSRSAGKSLTSVLLGIAVQNGVLASLDQPVYDLLGGVERFKNPDPRKEQMTVRHLVTMTSGLACDDDDYDSPGNEDRMQSQDDEPDWYRYTLNLPMARAPGEAGVYCTAGINLLGHVIQEATGERLPRFFHERFAEPLGISYYQMNLSPLYQAYMGGGLRLQPRDFLKMGQLYLDGGVWQGQRLLAETWVQDSAAPQATLYNDGDYGYAWWRRSYEVEGRAIDTYFASGNGGQLLFVVPELDLVVLIHAGNYSDSRTRNAFRDQYMQEAILPAALAAE